MAETAAPVDSNASPGPDAGAGAHAQRGEMLRAAGLVSFLTVVSRVLGLWRDRLLAGLFGATWISDAFNLAFILPNLTRRLFGEGALSSAFVPIFSEQLALEKRDEAFRTASVLLTRLAVFLILVSGVCVAAALGLSAQLGGAGHEAVALTLRLAAVMLFYCVLANVGAALMGVLNSLGHFAMPAFAPVLLNLSMIGACWYALKYAAGPLEERVYLVAWAVMAGGALQVLILVAPALARGFRYRPSLDKTDAGYREVMSKFGAIVLGVALFQINVLLDQLIARVMIPEDGPVTMLAYGNRLIQLPWAIFSLSVATAALPMLSRFWAKDDRPAFAHAVSAAVRNTLFLAVPSAVGLALLADDLVRLFYGTGAFLADYGETVRRTGRVVFYLALGLPFYSLNSVLARALYATKDMKTPTHAAAWSVGVNLVLNVILVLSMKEAGLALASAVSGAFQTLWMARALYTRLGAARSGRLIPFALNLAGGALLGVLGATYIQAEFGRHPDYEGFVIFFACAAAGILPLWLLGSSFFKKQVEPLRVEAEAQAQKSGAKSPLTRADLFRYGLPPRFWPEDLAFFHALYSVALSSAIMGIGVWAVRESLPPAGFAFALVFQRGAVPVVAGLIVYLFAVQGCQSHEYEELKSAFGRKLGRKKG
ncbi:MAG: murein biosynthesis integral membrane protein MurJ [Planctomycetota bacterium]|nr:murein biosynthesis integral membrane protein MurJ [Planctomycetota bacterium]